MYNRIKTGSIIIKSMTSGKKVQIDGVFAISAGNHVGQNAASTALPGADSVQQAFER